MSIANELCSEVATAVLLEREHSKPFDPREMSKILLEVYATLRRLHTDERRRSQHAADPGRQQSREEEEPRPNGRASASSH